MNEEIQNIRTELNNAIEETNSTQSKQVIEISEKLDVLILEYYKKSMNFSFQMSRK